MNGPAIPIERQKRPHTDTTSECRHASDFNWAGQIPRITMFELELLDASYAPEPGRDGGRPATARSCYRPETDQERFRHKREQIVAIPAVAPGSVHAEHIHDTARIARQRPLSWPEVDQTPGFVRSMKACFDLTNIMTPIAHLLTRQARSSNCGQSALLDRMDRESKLKLFRKSL